MASKKQSQASHARQSFNDRYGIILSEMLHSSMVKDIQTGVAEFLITQSNRVSIFVVKHNQIKIPVVYDGLRKQLVTALPPACVKPENIGVYLEHLHV